MMLFWGVFIDMELSVVLCTVAMRKVVQDITDPSCDWPSLVWLADTCGESWL